MAQSWPWDSQIAVKKKKKKLLRIIALELFMSQCQWKYTSVIENHNNVLRVIKFKCLLEIFKVPKGLLKLSTK